MKDKVYSLTEQMAQKEHRKDVLRDQLSGITDMHRGYTPNHIAKPLAWYDSILEPIHRGLSVIKSCCKWILRALLVLCVTGGIVLGVFTVRAYQGKPTPFTTIELMGLENNQQELAGKLEGMEDLLTSTKMRLDKIDKPKVEGKKVK